MSHYIEEVHAIRSGDDEYWGIRIWWRTWIHFFHAPEQLLRGGRFGNWRSLIALRFQSMFSTHRERIAQLARTRAEQRGGGWHWISKSGLDSETSSMRDVEDDDDVAESNNRIHFELLCQDSFEGVFHKFTMISWVGRLHYKYRCEQCGYLGEILAGTGAFELGSAIEAISCSSNSFEVGESVTREDSAASFLFTALFSTLRDNQGNYGVSCTAMRRLRWYWIRHWRLDSPVFIDHRLGCLSVRRYWSGLRKLMDMKMEHNGSETDSRHTVMWRTPWLRCMATGMQSLHDLDGASRRPMCS